MRRRTSLKRTAASEAQAELLAADHVTAMMYVEQRVREGREDTRQLKVFRASERRRREAAGYVCDVDVRFRVRRAHRWQVPAGMQQGRHRRAPARRRRIVRRGRSRSGRGSPPGDPDDDSGESDPGGDHFPPVGGAVTGMVVR